MCQKTHIILALIGAALLVGCGKTEIAFNQQANGEQALFRVKDDGKSAPTLILGTSRARGKPAWSPNRQRIAYGQLGGRELVPTNSHVELIVIDPTGQSSFGNWTEFSVTCPQSASFCAATNPDWSPDGSEIAYEVKTQSEDSFGIEIWKVDAQNPNRRESLAATSGNDVEPAWSPDGTQIAFASNADGNFEIYVMDADGENVVQLTHTQAKESRQPAWGTQGGRERIAFVRDRKIFTMDPSTPGSEIEVPNTQNTESPSWAPSVLAVVSSDGEIHLINPVNGTDVRKITTTGKTKDGLDWDTRRFRP